MDRDSFFSMFSNQDTASLYGLYNDLKSALKSSTPLCSKDFLTPNIWGPIMENKNKVDISLRTYGAFEESERRVLIFNSEKDFGVSIIKIENKNKFISLSHRDFLGGVLALGIKREKFGDFILKDNLCYFPCKEEIADYLKDNIKTIGKTNVKVNKIENISGDFFKLEYEDMVIDVPSLRLDSISAQLTRSSRSQGADLIKKGLVLCNYSEAYDKSKQVSAGDVITIRGYGKYKLIEEIGRTKKANLKIYIRKYK